MDIERLIANAPGFASRFEYRGLLGEGAMGAVFRARDVQREREVAIKVALHEANGAQIDAGTRKLWLQEMRLAGKLHHPHIVELHEAGDAGEFSYLVMECVDGGSLGRHAAPASLLPVDRVVDAVFKVARGLEYANSQGLLHRDVKPANVLLDGNGQPKVSDFGASFAVVESEITQVLGVGTIPFIPPEQLAGSTPDIQADLYATGMTAYMLLCGALPYDVSNPATLMHQKLNADPVPLGTKRRDLPPELVRTVDRAIQRERGERYPDWSAFCEDLSRLMPRLNARLDSLPESERYEQFRPLRFFAPFGEVELWEATRICAARRVRAGETIFREGTPGASVHVLCSGLLEVTRKGVKLGRIEAGDCFGELAFVEAPHHIRSATVVALEDATFAEFEAEAVSHASPRLQAALSRAIMGVLVARLHRADARYLERMQKGGWGDDRSARSDER